jgi:hypothetical protein
MAVAGVASADDNAVSALFKSTKNEHRIYTAGAGNADDLYISGVSKSRASRKVRTRIAAPVAAKSNYLGFEFVIYRHIASTSDKICLLEKP